MRDKETQEDIFLADNSLHFSDDSPSFGFWSVSALGFQVTFNANGYAGSVTYQDVYVTQAIDGGAVLPVVTAMICWLVMTAIVRQMVRTGNGGKRHGKENKEIGDENRSTACRVATVPCS